MPQGEGGKDSPDKPNQTKGPARLASPGTRWESCRTRPTPHLPTAKAGPCLPAQDQAPLPPHSRMAGPRQETEELLLGLPSPPSSQCLIQDNQHLRRVAHRNHKQKTSNKQKPKSRNPSLCGATCSGTCPQSQPLWRLGRMMACPRPDSTT